MKDYYLLVGLNSKEVKITKVNQNEKGVLEINIENKNKKVRCTKCNKFTSSIHSRLKPIRSVYLDACGTKVDLMIYKKRYHCYNCGKIFTEEMNINTHNGNISNKVKIQIRKDLLNYNLSIKYIAEKIANTKQMDLSQIARITYENACKIFKIKPLKKT